MLLPPRECLENYFLIGPLHHFLQVAAILGNICVELVGSRQRECWLLLPRDILKVGQNATQCQSRIFFVTRR